MTTIVLDFDGTITEEDILQEMSRQFGDPDVVHEVEDALRDGRITLQEEITREFRPVTAPLDEVVAWAVERSRLRPGLADLVHLARDRGWQRERAFERVRGDDHAGARARGPWRPRDPREQRRCAARRLARPVARRDDLCRLRRGVQARQPAGRGEVVYVGDGISDRCAAQAADRVFATRGLARYFDEHGLPYEPFDDFHDIVRALTG